jgi:hypothetical protein
MSFDDGSSIKVWIVGNLTDANGVLSHLPALDPETLHIVQIPLGPGATKAIFEPGYTMRLPRQLLLALDLSILPDRVIVLCETLD